MSALDREKAREVLQTLANDVADHGSVRFAGYLDALAGCVSDEPPTIDRDALAEEVADHLEQEYPFEHGDDGLLVNDEFVAHLTDRIIALLRPDPRIAKLEALPTQTFPVAPGNWRPFVDAGQVRAILRGEA